MFSIYFPPDLSKQDAHGPHCSHKQQFLTINKLVNDKNTW